MYRVELRPAAQRDLRRIPPHVLSRLRDAILGLAAEPRPSGCRKLKGQEEAYRLRLGPYRVLYEVTDTEQRVLVTRVRRRTESTYRRR